MDNLAAEGTICGGQIGSRRINHRFRLQNVNVLGGRPNRWCTLGQLWVSSLSRRGNTNQAQNVFSKLWMLSQSYVIQREKISSIYQISVIYRDHMMELFHRLKKGGDVNECF